MAAALRCLARKMARAPPPHRLYSVSGPGRSTTPSPPPPRIEDILTKENLIELERSRSQLIRCTKDQFATTTNTCISILVFGGTLYHIFVKPRLDELRDRVDALSEKVDGR